MYSIIKERLSFWFEEFMISSNYWHYWSDKYKKDTFDEYATSEKTYLDKVEIFARVGFATWNRMLACNKIGLFVPMRPSQEFTDTVKCCCQSTFLCTVYSFKAFSTSFNRLSFVRQNNLFFLNFSNHFCNVFASTTSLS